MHGSRLSGVGIYSLFGESNNKTKTMLGSANRQSDSIARKSIDVDFCRFSSSLARLMEIPEYSSRDKSMRNHKNQTLL